MREQNEIKCHELKIENQFFDAVADRSKTAELRKNDRDFLRGDFLLLKEWSAGKYSGRWILVKVTHVLCGSDYVQDGHCMLSFDEWQEQRHQTLIEEIAKGKMLTKKTTIQIEAKKVEDYIDRSCDE